MATVHDDGRKYADDVDGYGGSLSKSASYAASGYASRSNGQGGTSGQRYHIGANGEPMPCRAKGTCPLGGTHYDSLEDAYADLENQHHEALSDGAGPIVKNDNAAFMDEHDSDALEYVLVFKGMSDRYDADYTDSVVDVTGVDGCTILHLPRTVKEGTRITITADDMDGIMDAAEQWSRDNDTMMHRWDIAEDMLGNTMYNQEALVQGDARILVPEEYEPDPEYVERFIRENPMQTVMLGDEENGYRLRFYDYNTGSLDTYTADGHGGNVALESSEQDWTIDMNRTDIEMMKKAVMKYGIGKQQDR